MTDIYEAFAEKLEALKLTDTFLHYLGDADIEDLDEDDLDGFLEVYGPVQSPMELDNLGTASIEGAFEALNCTRWISDRVLRTRTVDIIADQRPLPFSHPKAWSYVYGPFPPAAKVSVQTRDGLTAGWWRWKDPLSGAKSGQYVEEAEAEVPVVVVADGDERPGDWRCITEQYREESQV